MSNKESIQEEILEFADDIVSEADNDSVGNRIAGRTLKQLAPALKVMKEATQRHFRTLSEKIADGIETDYKAAGRLVGKGLDEEAEKLEKAIKDESRCGPLFIQRDEEGRLIYSLALVGTVVNGRQRNYVWLEGGLDEQMRGYPTTVALKYLNGLEVEIKNPAAFKNYVFLAVDPLEQTLSSLQERCPADGFDLSGAKPRKAAAATAEAGPDLQP